MRYSKVKIYLKGSSRPLPRTSWIIRFWSENKANTWWATPAGSRSSIFEPIQLIHAIKGNFRRSIIPKALLTTAGYPIITRITRWCQVLRPFENTTVACGNIKILTWRRINFSNRSCNSRILPKRQCWARCKCQLCRHSGRISHPSKSTRSLSSTRNDNSKMKNGPVSKKKW